MNPTRDDTGNAALRAPDVHAVSRNAPLRAPDAPPEEIHVLREWQATLDGRPALGPQSAMCRSIRTLFNFEPPATDEEVRSASLQFVRKLSGFNAPSRANAAAFDRAVEEVTAVARRLVDDLVTTAPPRDREQAAAVARARYVKRFGRSA